MDEEWPLITNLSKAKVIKPDIKWRSLYIKSFLYFSEKSYSEPTKLLEILIRKFSLPTAHLALSMYFEKSLVQCGFLP